MQTRTDITVVTLGTDLDVTAVARVRRLIDQAIDSGCRRVVLNMAAARYVDSAGMGLIVSELRRLRAMGGLLSLTNVSPQVFHALEVMRMVDMMPVAEAGSRCAIAAADPTTLPYWRRSFRVDAYRLEAARERVVELLGQMPFSDDELFDMRLAVGEALGNAVDHTCGGGVLVTVAAYDDRAIVQVTDCGDGFALDASEEPPVVGEHAERGRGIRLMRMLTDAVSIGPKTSGTGTIVRLVKLVRS